MDIDWFTVVAQLLNFLVLLWLMKRFLYKPILNAIDEREKRIAEELMSAQTKKDAAEIEKKMYERKNEEINKQSSIFLKNAQDEGQAEKRRLLDEAREAAESLSAKRREELTAEEKSLREEVTHKIQNEVVAITRKILTDLAEKNLDEQIVEVFIRRLHNLDSSEIKALVSAVKTSSKAVTVKTAFDISSKLRLSAEASINEITGSQANIIFESVPDLICGIELSINGQKIAWSIADYLSSIDEGLGDFFKEPATDSKTDPKDKTR